MPVLGLLSSALFVSAFAFLCAGALGALAERLLGGRARGLLGERLIETGERLWLPLLAAAITCYAAGEIVRIVELHGLGASTSGTVISTFHTPAKNKALGYGLRYRFDTVGAGGVSGQHEANANVSPDLYDRLTSQRGVTVRYDAADPSRSDLEGNVNRGWTLVIVLAALLAIGAAIVQRRRARAISS